MSEGNPFRRKHFSLSDCLRLDKEDDGGPWLLTCRLPCEPALFRLRITVGGPWDWFLFVAEIEETGSPPITLGEFELAPLEIIPRRSDRFGDNVAEPWDPAESLDFCEIPVEYQQVFEVMVRRWGRLAGLMVPAVVWRTLH